MSLIKLRLKAELGCHVPSCVRQTLPQPTVGHSEWTVDEDSSLTAREFASVYSIKYESGGAR